MPDFTLNDLFPQSSRLLLTGGGKDFIERIGIEAAKQVVLGVLTGENVRTQTEPLTRRRIAQLSGAMAALFINGHSKDGAFTSHLSELAVQQITTSKKNGAASIWPAQWIIGLTGKSVQNVLRSNSEARKAYIQEFEKAIQEAAETCRTEIGDMTMTLGFKEDKYGSRSELNWHDVTRLTTAIGSLTLTIRGSDKSIYGKLLERLVLGSVLSILGFQRVSPSTNTRTERVFWLSDSTDTRECDATVLLAPGKLARFDIGFIGPGNSEISKDKLSRFAREIEHSGLNYASHTFIIVDRLPNTSKTRLAAEKINAEIVQTSMQYWPKELAQRLSNHFDYRHELQNLPDDRITTYLADKLKSIPIQEFLQGVTLDDLQNNTEQPGNTDV